MKRQAWMKMLLTTCVVAMAAIPLTAAAKADQVQGTVVSQTENQSSNNMIHETGEKKPEQQETFSTKGTIDQITYTKNGAYVMMKGKSAQTQNMDELRVVFAKGTLVVDQNGKQADLLQALNEGWTVTAYYGPAMTSSIPPQVTAEKFVVERPDAEEEFKTTGIITEAGKDRITISGEYPIILNLTGDTKITDESGKVLTKDALNQNVRVEVEYSPVMTRSLPPISHAVSIVVKEETVRAEGTIGKVNQHDGKTSVAVDVKADGGQVSGIVLNTDENTVIVNQSGEKLDAKDLKAGQKIIGYHAQIMTMSLPPQSYAYQIVVAN
ncbi:hypothetical protein [Paenibacillus apiarius]|uniref:hypothetical protein n=1 Tax=Paenibacillus apiarius TaxID=46240 RepID=UPI003B3B35BD